MIRHDADGEKIILVVSNPVELVVAVFSQLRMPEVARVSVLRLEEGDYRPIWELAAEVESRGGED